MLDQEGPWIEGKGLGGLEVRSGGIRVGSRKCRGGVGSVWEGIVMVGGEAGNNISLGLGQMAGLPQPHDCAEKMCRCLGCVLF